MRQVVRSKESEHRTAGNQNSMTSDLQVHEADPLGTCGAFQPCNGLHRDDENGTLKVGEIVCQAHGWLDECEFVDFPKNTMWSIEGGAGIRSTTRKQRRKARL